jgi:hypothetical protein
MRPRDLECFLRKKFVWSIKKRNEKDKPAVKYTL